MTNPPGTTTGSIPVDPETARRAARVVGVSRLEQTGPEVAREGVHGPAHDRDPGSQPERIGGGLGQAADDLPIAWAVAAGRPGRPHRGDRAAIGTTWSGHERRMATPESRNASHSQVVRYQRVAAATAGSWRSTQSAAGSPPSDQPWTPVAAFELGRLGRRPRVEERDRRPGRLAASIDRDQRRPVTVDPDRDDLGEVGGPQRPDGADDRRPPRSGSCSTQP